MTTEIIPFKEPRALAGLAARLPAVFLPNEKASERFFGLFTAHIRNRNTRRAYYNAACRFADWCEGRGLSGLADVKPPHVAAYIEGLGVAKPEGPGRGLAGLGGGEPPHGAAFNEGLGGAKPEGPGLSKPSGKQHLAALRMLF